MSQLVFWPATYLHLNNRIGKSMKLDEQQKEEVQQLILKAYSRYNSSSSSLSKYNILYSIIDMKSSIGDVKVYRDIKRCVKHHVESAEEQDFGYDLIFIDKITEVSDVLPIIEKRDILKYFSRTLEEHGYEEEKEQVDILIKKINIEIMSQRIISKINPFYYASIISLKSPAFISFLIFAVLLLEFIFLLPAPYKNFEAVSFSPHAYTNNIYIDTLVSIPIMILSIDDDIKVKPISLIGAIDVVLAKFFFVVVVANFLIKKLEEKNKI